MRTTAFTASPKAHFTAAAPRASVTRRSVLVHAQQRQQLVQADETLSSRRSALLLSAALLGAIANGPANAAILCVDQDTAEAGTECREQQLMRDASSQESYGDISKKQKFTTAGGVPVAEMGDAYSKETYALGQRIQEYAAMDVYSKARTPLIKELKQEGLTWVSKYARGGSARKQSARKMYTAVDAVVGHFAANGLAPYPAAKMKVVLQNIQDAEAYMAEGR